MYDKIVNIINFINSFIAGNILVWGLLGVGAYLSLKTKFVQIFKFKKSLEIIFNNKKNNSSGSLSSFQALATSIAAQVGTGNVAGVATAVTTGGPGSIFWMWITAFLGMGTIFTEACLAQKYRERKNGELVGGPAYYMIEGLKGKYKKFSKFFATFFSIAIILALGFMGNAVQSNSIAHGLRGVQGLEKLNPVIIGICVAVFTGLIFAGGMKRIGKFAEMVVPIMAIVYILGSFVILILNYSEIIPMLLLIFKSAFTGNAAIGGILGATVKEAVQMGVARGVFTNEAGMGSTPHAHAVAHVNHPVEQGLASMFGVLVSLIICTSTALTVIVTKSYEFVDINGKYLKGAQLTQFAFKTTFGEAGSILLAICIIFFAFTTIVGWYYFGESNIKILLGDKFIYIYRIIVLLFIVVGAIAEVDIVWSLADIFNSLMVLPNIITIGLLSHEVKKLLVDYEEQDKLGNINYIYEYEDKEEELF